MAWDEGLEAYDYCTVDEIRQLLAANDYRIRSIIFGIVDSKAFRIGELPGNDRSI